MDVSPGIIHVYPGGLGAYALQMVGRAVPDTLTPTAPKCGGMATYCAWVGNERHGEVSVSGENRVEGRVGGMC